MSIEKTLQNRSNNSCELCKSTSNLSVYEVPPHSNQTDDDSILVCDKCLAQLDKKEALDVNHWNCLNDSMWSEVPAVQVVAWRMLSRLRNETWAVDALDMLYFSDENLAWAKSTGDHENSSEVELHRDCNGAILQTGDSVVIIKTLEVKGSQVDAKVGTAVKNIRVVHDNIEHIEGKIDGQSIVILTKFVRKS
jgi:protein PhnA